MRKHISIFALLLSAFAAVGTAGAADNLLYLMLETEGIYLEGSKKDRGNLIRPIGTWNTRLSSGSRQYDSILSNGLKVAKWEYASNKNSGPWTDLGQSGTNITWTYRSDMSNVYLRPWLEWLHYSLSYNANGGSGSMSGQSDVRYDAKVSLPKCEFTKEGYSFAGWSVAKTGGTVWPAGTKCDGHDFGVDAQKHDYGKDAKGTPVTLYAQWTPNQYTVTFDANCTGGSSDPASKKVTYDSTYGELPTPTRPGTKGRTQDESWQFDGWYDSSSNEVKSTSKVSITNDVSLYAHWTEKFEVKYVDAAKFINTLLKTEYVLSGGTATPPDNPAHTGYTFTEWTGWNGFSDVKQDRTYTAVYTGNGYKVVFHSCLVPDETHSQDFTYGESKALAPNTFVNAGHTFLGWAETAGSRTVKWKDETPVTDLATGGEVHLYAAWDANAYRIVFDGNGGSGEMDPIDMRYGVATNLPLNTFDYDGLDFKSWRDELNKTNYLDGATVSNLTTEAGGTVTLKAVWFEGYFVEFYGGKGASGEMPRQQFACDAEVALPLNEFTKKGYTFTHWTNTQGKVFLDGAVVKDLAPMGETAALHAVWTPNKYYVKFDDNGANWGEMAVQEFTYDKAQELTANDYGGNFLKFRGWAASPDATTREYADEELISNLTDVPNETIVLYAVWQSTLSDLSEAADCANLNLKAGKGNFDFGGQVIVDFVVDTEVGHQGPSSCRGTGERSGMTANLSTPGTLTFWARATGEDCMMYLYENNGGTPVRVKDVDGQDVVEDSQVDRGWHCWTVRFETAEEIMWFGRDREGDGNVWVDAVVWEPDGVTLHFDANGGTDAPADLKIPLGSRDKLPREVPTRSGYAFKGWQLGSETEKLYQPRETYTAGSEITTITFTAVWEPTGEHPVPVDGEDNVTISSAAVSDGKFSLSFQSDERFDYNLRTNANLLIDSWGIMETLVGDGSMLKFEPEIIKGQPQLFYKVETIQK